MTQAEQVGQQADLGGFSKGTRAAKEFSAFWRDRGDEKQETSRFWIELLGDVLGIGNPARYIEFEKKVKLRHTSFIDGYISSTKVLIEQKGARIDLARPQEQSDGATLTPYEQAKRYADELPYDLRPRWIVVCNFRQIHVHDMNKPHAEPEIILLENLEKELYRLQFLVDSRNEQIRREEEVSLQAGILVGRLYDALIKEYLSPDERSFRSLNILCVRLVFCFYAEDAGLFETRTSFEDYIRSFSLPSLRDALIKLFRGLDTELENRDKYDTSLAAFPYVNGGLFAAEDIEIPNLTQEIVDVLVNHCAPFNWAEISPTIFGAVFESTLNPETRRTGGMHYTSIENIHRVIDPLFLDELEAEFESIASTGSGARKLSPKERAAALHAFQEKLGSLKFLDPACGSGNFLTETYLSLRRLENKVISILNRGEKVLGFDEFIKVRISQFHGIEINDFAVTVAKTALWIAESQMMAETEKILSQSIDFFPLTTNAFIVEGNALRMNWATLKPIDENVQLNDGLFAGFATEVDGNEIQYDYIMGNPPFVGTKYQNQCQKEDVIFVSPEFKMLDYVCCWYKKARDLIQGKNTKCAFVSTNSITQGEQVAPLWKNLKNIEIDFAYQTFKWDSESISKAQVHVVIIGFSCHAPDESKCVSSGENLRFSNEKRIFNSDGTAITAKNINGYLIDAPSVFIEARKTPICTMAQKMTKGSQPTDGGNLLLEEDEKENLIKKYPFLEKYIKRYMGAVDLINNTYRYCLWLKNISPTELRKTPELMERLEKVKQSRLASPKESTKKWADRPTLFTEDRQPNEDYMILPVVSSENREYMPIGYVSKDVIANTNAQMIPKGDLFTFGILNSKIHNSWMHTVCGRMKSDYAYSATIVYNNFPFPNPTEEQKAKIEQTAQAILDTRSQFPEASLADLYNPLTMPPVLRKAHEANDKAVMEAYHFDKLSDRKFDMGEGEVVAELFRLYEKLAQASK